MKANARFIAFWLAGDGVAAGMNANVWGVNDVIQDRIRSGRPVAADDLGDPAIPLDHFSAAA